ncbi:serine/threonine-protein phosphatase [Actinocrinis puniceicyclus]|uniref:Serine/threonine-protein phosphatase n=1 Tax=Actinocrinis puniceicyclus TaxID=977794 RepID=A0A8J7WWC4_9ACTN|nr:protein phosphatase 2C domain-containing protein [Actinocrinis puniceicyclus]MBS2966319.1 serine/threonine-protein phosphatase [Actinocrinis puniceicyclus]
MLTVRSAAATDIGRVRKHNEDNAFVGTKVFVVADGMGGHAAGDLASALAVARLRRLDEVNCLDAETLRAHLALANADILDTAEADPQREGMGTTVAGLGLTSIAGTYHWLVFNVGDCRVYRYGGGELAQLTIDHTEVAELVAAGKLTAEQAWAHPRRNVVTRALGADPAPPADVWIVPAGRGERFVVCSDGLPLEVADAQLAQTLDALPEAAAAAAALVRQAVAAGGRDNVTVIVVDTAQQEGGGAGLAAEDAGGAHDASDDTVPRENLGSGSGSGSGSGTVAL